MNTSIVPKAAASDLQTQTPLEVEVATLIVEILHLEIAPGDVAPMVPLFRDGLGLDSIDALELSLAISKRYGVSLRSDDDRNSEIFANLRSLARFIATQRPV